MGCPPFSGSPIERVVLHLLEIVAPLLFFWALLEIEVCVFLLDILLINVLFLDNDRFDGIWVLCYVIHSLKSKCILWFSSALCYYFDPEVVYYVVLHLVCIFMNKRLQLVMCPATL